MRHSTLALLASLCFTAVASADVQVTNVNQNDDGFVLSVLNTTSAQGFITGPGNPWLLKSVSLIVDYVGNGPTTVVVRLRSSLPNGLPGAGIGIWEPYSLDPGTHPLIVFATGEVLQPSTRYYITFDVAPNAVQIRVTDNNAECSMTGWSIEDYGVTQESVDSWPAWGTTSVRMTLDADPIIPAPIVTSVTGCTDTPPKTINCPNAGGVNLQIHGQNFTPDTIILIGGIPAMNINYSSPALISCVLPPGAGRNHPITAVNGTDAALLTNAISYSAPPCPGDANGDGVVNFADITAALALFNSPPCP